jgi:hypothetical protein
MPSLKRWIENISYPPFHLIDDTFSYLVMAHVGDCLSSIMSTDGIVHGSQHNGISLFLVLPDTGSGIMPL